MLNRYIHDTENRILYRFPASPEIEEQTDRRGQRTGWAVRMEIVMTRAQNRLVDGRLEHASSEYPEQHFLRHYERAQALSFFNGRHTPKGNEISQSEYERLLSEYGVLEGNRHR